MLIDIFLYYGNIFVIIGYRGLLICHISFAMNRMGFITCLYWLFVLCLWQFYCLHIRKRITKSYSIAVYFIFMVFRKSNVIYQRRITTVSLSIIRNHACSILFIEEREANEILFMARSSRCNYCVLFSRSFSIFMATYYKHYLYL